jgi:hypothetical protein
MLQVISQFSLGLYLLLDIIAFFLQISRPSPETLLNYLVSFGVIFIPNFIMIFFISSLKHVLELTGNTNPQI